MGHKGGDEEGAAKDDFRIALLRAASAPIGRHRGGTALSDDLVDEAPRPARLVGRNAGAEPSRRPAPWWGPDGHPRTDLAVEAAAGRARTMPGVHIDESSESGVDITRVQVLDADGERVVGKPRGTYVTLDAPGLLQRDRQMQEAVARLLAREIGRLADLRGPDSHVFVVGLGNWHATPDALGPKVVEAVLVTRHLQGQVPADTAGDVRPVSAIAPGVLGLTGIETSEIIRGIVDRTAPAAVIAVDALASRSIERLGRTIQVADTGIQPGSGVGNRRAALNEETLGTKVIAVGVPTVVHAATIASDTLDLLAENAGEPRYAALRELRGESRRELIARVLGPAVGDLMVTPKEIDALIHDLSRVIAAGINAAVHPRVAAQELLLA